MQVKTPYKDSKGIQLNRGDVVRHRAGEVGQIILDKSLPDHLQWRVRYSNGYTTALSILTKPTVNAIEKYTPPQTPSERQKAWKERQRGLDRHERKMWTTDVEQKQVVNLLETLRSK